MDKKEFYEKVDAIVRTAIAARIEAQTALDDVAAKASNRRMYSVEHINKVSVQDANKDVSKVIVKDIGMVINKDIEMVVTADQIMVDQITEVTHAVVAITTIIQLQLMMISFYFKN